MDRNSVDWTDEKSVNAYYQWEQAQGSKEKQIIHALKSYLGNTPKVFKKKAKDLLDER